MNKNLIHAIAAGAGLVFSTGALAEETSKAQQQATEKRIAADYKAAKTGCDSLSANAKDVCVAEAKGKAAVARAELAAQQKPTAKNTNRVHEAKADATYAVAIQRCDDRAGNDKDVCVKEAKAAKVRAIADAKTKMTSTEANAKSKEITSKANAEARETTSKVNAEANETSAKASETAANANAASANATATAKDSADKAKAAARQTAAQGEAKANETKREARQDATEEKREANYAVDKEKCDSLSGAAKDACLGEAKMQSGKR